MTKQKQQTDNTSTAADTSAADVRIDVQLIEVHHPAALIEYVKDKRAVRVIVPFAQLINEQQTTLELRPFEDVQLTASAQLLDAGIAYGAPWEKIISINASADAVAAALRNAGVWTLEDALAMPDVVRGALAAVLALDLSSFFQSIQRVKESQE